MGSGCSGCEFLSMAIKMFWSLVVMVTKLRECTKKHWIIHFKSMNFMVCDVYLNKATSMLDFYLYCEYHLLFASNPSSNTVHRNLDVCFQRASTSCLTWTGIEMLVEVGIALEKGVRGWGLSHDSVILAHWPRLGKSPCFSESQVPILKIHMTLALCIS